MKIAVLTLTRDRLDYTRHCFATLEENAGCDYDHYVLDQGSQDGTVEWLTNETDCVVAAVSENIGINRGLNLLIDTALRRDVYDVIVKFDNDCELMTPNTLRDLALLAVDTPALLSPRIHGLRQPPQTIDRESGIDVTPVIGGIFMAAPAVVFTDHGYRHDGRFLLGDDSTLCRWWQERGGIVGYAHGYDANHFETTDGQHARYPAYFERKYSEMVA